MSEFQIGKEVAALQLQVTELATMVNDMYKLLSHNVAKNKLEDLPTKKE